jgi:hypothetical protein
MPSIPIIEQRTSASMAGLGPGPSGGRGLEAVGDAIGNAGRAQTEVHLREIELRDRDAIAAANAEIASARTHWIEQYQQRQQNAPAGAEGFTPQLMEDFDKDKSERLQRAKTPNAKRYLEQKLADVRLGLYDDALSYEAVAGAKHREGLLMQSVDGAKIAAGFRPEEFDSLLQEQNAGIAATGATAQRAEELRTGVKAQLAEAAVLGLIERNPAATLKQLNNEKSNISSINALTFEDRNRLRTTAEAEVRRLDAEAKGRQVEARQAMNERLQDIVTAAQLGIPIDVPPKAVLQALYGEQDGAKRHQFATQLAGVSNVTAQMHQMSTPELAAASAMYRPTSVEGASDQVQLQAIVARNAKAIAADREEDPGGYLLQHSPLVQQAFAKVSDDPAGFMSALRAEKERLGISSPAALPDAYVQRISDQINQAGSAESLAQRIDEEAQRWGKAWPQVQGQLMGKISDVAMVIGSGIPQSSAVALAATAHMGDAELKTMLPPSTTWGNLTQRIDSQFADFQNSMPPEAAKTVAAVKDAAARLALKYMHDGDSLIKAAGRAHRDLVDSQYLLTRFRGKTLRLPRQAPVREITYGAQVLLDKYEPQGAIAVPPGAAMTVDEYSLRFQAYVRKNGYWVTRPDGEGLRMYVDGGPVVAGGKPFDATWQELATQPIDPTYYEVPYAMRGPYE